MKIIAFLCFVLLFQEVIAQRALKKVVIIEEYAFKRLLPPKRRALLEIHFDKDGNKTHFMKYPCSIGSLDVFGDEDPFLLMNSRSSTLRSIQDTAVYQYEYDENGRLIAAYPFDEETDEEELRIHGYRYDDITPTYWRFMYDGTEQIIKSSSKKFGLYGGGSRFIYNEKGLVDVIEYWHPRGIVSTTEHFKYRNGLPIIKETYWRRDTSFVVARIMYSYVFY